jgi:hypothetical protein
VIVIEGRWYSTAFHRRVATWGGIACLVLASIAIGAFTGSAPGREDPRFAIVWAVCFGLLGLFILTRARRAAVRTTPKSLEVRNAFRSFSIPWDEIEGFGSRWAGGLISLGYVKPKMGRRRLLSGTRRWTWSASDPIVDQLNQALSRHRGELPPPPIRND